MFKEFVKQMGANMTSLADGDYTKDGLVYCGNCHTPKQCFVKELGMAMPTPCECKKEAMRQEEEREQQIKKKLQIEMLRHASLLGERYRNASFENTGTAHSEEYEAVYNRCKRYCEVADLVLKNGTGIYLFGTKGTGKSRLTACMGNELMKNLYTVLYTNFAEIQANLINKEGYINTLAETDFLFIDDFGTEKVTKGKEDMWMQEKVFEVINKRYIDNKPIIFTSNYSLKELIEERGMADKTIDRIMEMCEVMKLTGVSYRITAMREREKLF